MTTTFLGKIARRIMATTSNDLDRFTTPECERLADWVMKNFAFGPRVLLRRVGPWERENREGEGIIILTVKTDYRDRMHDRWDRGVFRVALDRSGFPVRAEAVTRFGNEDAWLLATQTDFSVLSELTSFQQLDSIHAPFTETLDTMEPISEWAFDNMAAAPFEKATPAGDWKVAREHGSVLFSRDATFTGTGPHGAFHKKGTFFVAFAPDGTPAGAWARADSRPFALRERGQFDHPVTDDFEAGKDRPPRSPTP